MTMKPAFGASEMRVWGARGWNACGQMLATGACTRQRVTMRAGNICRGGCFIFQTFHARGLGPAISSVSLPAGPPWARWRKFPWLSRRSRNARAARGGGGGAKEGLQSWRCWSVKTKALQKGKVASADAERKGARSAYEGSGQDLQGC